MSVYVSRIRVGQLDEASGKVVDQLVSQSKEAKQPTQAELTRVCQQLSTEDLLKYWELLALLREGKRKLAMLSAGVQHLIMEKPELSTADLPHKLRAMADILEKYSVAQRNLGIALAETVADIELYRRGVGCIWNQYKADRRSEYLGEPVLDEFNVPVIESRSNFDPNNPKITRIERFDFTKSFAWDKARLETLKTYLSGIDAKISGWAFIFYLALAIAILIVAYKVGTALERYIAPPGGQPGPNLFTWVGIGVALIGLGIGASFVLK